jgi:hypothetical protein|tara:strand:+ start:133 stop:276 length:144 start_codon:yes stop_codon:yes gene_type:complete
MEIVALSALITSIAAGASLIIKSIQNSKCTNIKCCGILECQRKVGDD